MIRVQETSSELKEYILTYHMSSTYGTVNIKGLRALWTKRVRYLNGVLEDRSHPHYNRAVEELPTIKALRKELTALVKAEKEGNNDSLLHQ